MEIEIRGTGAFDSALVHLQPGEQFISESGAMYRTSSNVDIDVTTRSRGKGGILAGVKRLLSAENFFFSTYSTDDGRPGEVGIAPTHQGQIRAIELDGTTNWLCAGGSYLGSTADLQIDTQFQGFKGFLTGEAPFFLNVTGQGQLLVNGYGRLVELNVTEPLTVDTGHLVAYEGDLQYTLSKAGGSWLHSMLAGEGIVMQFTGQGRIITQSHNPKEFGKRLGPLLPDRRS